MVRERMRVLTSAALIVAFAALMAVCAQINAPMVPVPMTTQTFAVLLAGALLGAWRGATAVLLYLALGAAGLPVLSDGASGLEHFIGPTAGYLVAFPVAAVLVGALYDRAGSVTTKVGLLLAAHLLILAVGTAWLATAMGAAAVAAGFTPFLIGALVKSGLVVAGAAGLRRWPVFRSG